MGGIRYLRQAPAVAETGLAATLVLLHGFGRYRGHLLDLWSKLDVDCPVVALQAVFRIGPAAYRWFAYEDLPGGGVAIAADEERLSREALISYLEARRRQRPERPLFVFGHGQGATMALSVALLRPGLLDGCAVLNGRILPETLDLRPDRPDLGGMPVFVGHGLVDRGRSTRDPLTSMGARLTYREYPAAQEVTPDMLAEVVQWLRACLAERGSSEGPPRSARPGIAE